MSWLRRFFHRTKVEQELDEEIQSYLDRAIDEKVERGMSPQEARREALVEFGGTEQVKELMREDRSGAWLETLVQDVRYAVRGFLRAPSFTITAILAVALGIGATTAVFSVVDLLLFRSLPYAHADRLVSMGVVAPIEQQEFMFGATYAQLRQGLQSFEAFTSWSGVSDCDITEQNPVHTKCARVEGNFLSTLGIGLALGRHFTLEEDQTNGPRVAAISYALWRGRFAGDPQILGKTLPVDGQTREIVGVLAPDFELPNLVAVDVIMPQGYEDARLRRQSSGPIPPLRVFGRLKPGANIAQAEAELQPLFKDSLKDVPPRFWSEVKLRIRSMRDRQIQDAKLVSWILLGAVAAVLLIACANVANLLLARAISRQRELAMRAALGAGRGRLIRQALTESLLLGVSGGAAGCALAYGLLKAVVAIAPDGIPRLQQASIDPRVLLFTFAVSVCSGMLFGLTPALESPKPERLAGWRTVGASRHLLRQVLVIGQIAASLVLLVGAALLLRTLWNLQNAPLGIRSDNVLIAGVSLGPQRYPQRTQCVSFFDQLETRFLETPALRRFAVSDSLPPSGSARTHIFSTIEAQGQPRREQGTGGMVVWRYVTPGYFDSLGIPILRGRGFTEEDRNAEDSGIVLSETLARRLFPNADPVGQQVRPGTDPSLSVIGIAADVRNGGFAYPDDPEYYLLRKHNLSQTAGEIRGVPGLSCNASVIVRTSESPKTVSEFIRSAVAGIDPTIPVTTEMLERRVYKLTARQRFNATVLGLFAGIGALLAAVGLYGVISFFVAQRTQEIGVRIALGAQRGDIIRMILSHAGRWTLTGAIAGTIGALATTRLLQALLFGVTATDPVALGTAVAVITALALFAAWIPSRRASRVDPLTALRQD